LYKTETPSHHGQVSRVGLIEMRRMNAPLMTVNVVFSNRDYYRSDILVRRIYCFVQYIYMLPLLRLKSNYPLDHFKYFCYRILFFYQWMVSLNNFTLIQILKAAIVVFKFSL